MHRALRELRLRLLTLLTLATLATSAGCVPLPFTYQYRLNPEIIGQYRATPDRLSRDASILLTVSPGDTACRMPAAVAALDSTGSFHFSPLSVRTRWCPVLWESFRGYRLCSRVGGEVHPIYAMAWIRSLPDQDLVTCHERTVRFDSLSLLAECHGHGKH